MSTMETNLKQHTCPKCGGSLNVKLDIQKYECPFCNSEFDYEYFDKDDLLTRADQCRQKKEWNAANDAYNFLLAKDPHSFLALRGRVLVAAHMPQFFNLSLAQSDVRKKNTIASICAALRVVDEEHRDYFEIMKEIYTSIERCDREQKNLESIKDKKRRMISNYYSGQNDDLKISPEVFGATFAIVFIVIIMFSLVIKGEPNRVTRNVVIIISVLIGIVVSSLGPKIFGRDESIGILPEEADRRVEVINKSIKANEQQLEKLQKRITELAGDIEKLENSFLQADQEPSENQ